MGRPTIFSSLVALVHFHPWPTFKKQASIARERINLNSARKNQPSSRWLETLYGVVGVGGHAGRARKKHHSCVGGRPEPEVFYSPPPTLQKTSGSGLPPMDELDEHGGAPSVSKIRLAAAHVKQEAATRLRELARKATGLLSNLLGSLAGGRPVTDTSAAATRARVVRTQPPGYASKTASLFAAVIAEVNEVHALGASPLTFRDVLPHLEQGRTLLTELQVAKETRVLASGMKQVVSDSGRACKRAVLGIMAAKHPEGTLSTRRVKELTGMSSSAVQRGRNQVAAGNLGTFGNQATSRYAPQSTYHFTTTPSH